MRISSSLVLALCLVALPRLAQAGLFGGFDKSGSYLRGSDQICAPVSSPSGASACETKSRAQLAKLSFDKGVKQMGASAKVAVRKKGSSLEILASDDKRSLFRWNSGDILDDLGAVHLDASGRFVAIEFTTRFGGRAVDDLVVIRLPKALASSSATPPATPAQPSTPLAPVAAPAKESASFVKAMSKGSSLAKRRKHKKAIALFEQALADTAGHPEALYRLARSQYASKDKKAALRSLAALAASTHPEVPRWRVEARFDKVFSSLRADSQFRAAVGIDRKPGELVSTFERLVALGGRWEQESMPCEQPQVNLDLQRDAKSRFDLVIRSKCQGSLETTRLDGSWRAKGSDELRLRFPNMDTDDEELVCRLELCADGSGEDCLRCMPEPDLEFLLRVVRR